MSAPALLDDILRLPAEQRLQLVAAIWDSLADTPAEVPVPAWHRELLDARRGYVKALTRHATLPTPAHEVAVLVTSAHSHSRHEL